MSGSRERYYYRQFKWTKKQVSLPLVRHHFWWLLHNCISHPLLVIPNDFTIWFHDWTSQYLNVRDIFYSSSHPVITDYKIWIYHNIVAHVLIGLFPFEIIFKHHDRTAEAMKVKDWL